MVPLETRFKRRLLLDNLLVNALKFSPPYVTVEVSLHRHGHQLTLLLHDQGPGIATRVYPDTNQSSNPKNPSQV